jgi:hypothetical protein
MDAESDDVADGEPDVLWSGESPFGLLSVGEEVGCDGSEVVCADVDGRDEAGGSGSGCGVSDGCSVGC